MRSPTAVLPVKLTMSTSGDSTSASPDAGVDPVTTLMTPGGKPTLLEDADELDDRERVLRRRAHDDGVAHRQRGTDLARHVHDREVVRRDARDDADGRAPRERAHEPARRQRRRRLSCGGNGITDGSSAPSA